MSYGRVCPHGHAVIDGNAKRIGTRWACVECRRLVHAKSLRILKEQVRIAYGGCCECCGEDTPEFLCLDHRDGGGSAARRAKRGGNFGGDAGDYREARREGFPDRFRILCWNCNFGVTRPEGCPHQRGKPNAEAI